MTDLPQLPVTTLQGEPTTLAELTGGKPALVVNVASRCGLTPQYTQLEALHEEYGPRGFTVIGVPSNQFAGQEPGNEQEIKTFCETRFNVDFPLTAKTDVKGDSAHPFYKGAKAALGEPAEPAWNFHKILIGKNGEFLRAFGPRTEPTASEVTEAIEGAL